MKQCLQCGEAYPEFADTCAICEVDLRDPSQIDPMAIDPSKAKEIIDIEPL